MSGRCILILGGARSGKSSLAQEMAQGLGGKVLFVATAEPLDEEMKSRIEIHKINRPRGWRTLEATAGVGEKTFAQIDNAEVVVIDCVTVLVSNVMFAEEGNDRTERNGVDYFKVEGRVMAEIEELIGCIDRVNARFIIVTNEVGLGLVPADRVSRLYRDWLGRANQMLAHHADEVIMMVAGLPVTVKTAQ